MCKAGRMGFTNLAQSRGDVPRCRLPQRDFLSQRIPKSKLDIEPAVNHKNGEIPYTTQSGTWLMVIQARGDIDSTALTLRFKHGVHTVLLFAESSTPFTTIKTDLLDVLRERYPDGIRMGKTMTMTDIPTDIGDLALAEPTDQYDISKGWTELDIGGSIRETPGSLKLKDGAILAFAFTTEEDTEAEFYVESPDLDALYGDDV